MRSTGTQEQPDWIVRLWILLMVAAVMGAGASLAGANPASRGAAADGATLNGRWILNQEKSDRPMEKLRDARSPGGEQRNGPPGGGIGGGRRPGAGAGPPSGARGGPGGPGEGRGGEMRAAMAELAPVPVLRISGGRERLVLDGGERGTHEIHTGPRPAGAPRGAASVAWPGRWEKDALLVEREGPQGAVLRESYRLEDQGRRLVIQTRLEPAADAEAGRRPMPAFEFKRVYERAAGGTPGSSAGGK